VLNDSKKAIRRVELTMQDTQMYIMQFECTDHVYQISFSAAPPDEIFSIIEDLKSRKEHSDEEGLWEALLGELRNKGISIRHLPLGDLRLNFQLNTVTGEKTALVQALTPGDHGEIARDIANAITHVFSNIGIETVSEMESALQRQDLEKAFKCLERGKNEGLLHFGSKETKLKVFHLAQQINAAVLEPAQRKIFYEIKFVLAEAISHYSYLYHDVDAYIEEFGGTADQALIRNLYLVQANAAAQQGKSELAYALYQQILKDQDCDYGTAAWAHRGMALILRYQDPVALDHESQASDAFLLAGDKEHFVGSMVTLAEHTKNNDLDKAIHFLDQAMNALDLTDVFQREKIAAVLMNKAMIYHRAGMMTEALGAAEDSLALRNQTDQFGNEPMVLASLNAVMQFQSPATGQGNSMQDKYNIQVEQLEHLMLDIYKESYTLHNKLADALDSKNSDALESLGDDVLQQGNPELSATYWSSLFIVKTNLDIRSRLELLENAWSEVSKPKVRDDLKCNVCCLFGEVYKDSGDDDKAIGWYRKAIDYNPYFWTSRQNYAALLWKNGRWNEAATFFKDQRKRFGDLPKLLYAHGRSLLESGEAAQAVPLLRVAQKAMPEADYVTRHLNQALDSLGANALSVAKDTLLESSLSVSIDELERCLADFVRFVQSDKRMTFWNFHAKEKKHKWVSSPEQHGQNLLHTFVKSRFGENVEAMEEINTGAGRIDIYLRFQGGVRTIIELKMCGMGYSEGYAREGIQQLVHYLDNKQTHLGYLMVFDGRLRDFKKGIETNYSFGQFGIRSWVCDVRPKVKP